MTGAEVCVRDSKDQGGAVLVFPAARWTDFVGALRCARIPVWRTAAATLRDRHRCFHRRQAIVSR
jgi:hypothetical protein